ncbi:MAG: ubiquinol-cytochrome C chaperone family protein [Magnetovibrionaceae bacterium]
MGLLDFFSQESRTRKQHARRLYETVVIQARQPVFYAEWGVPDTVDGRFDMIGIHAWLLMRRLRQDEDRTKELAQATFDLMFADMDQNLRELGIGDMGIASRIKKMAKAFYGRIAAYDEGLDGLPGTLEAALKRNAYRKCDPESDQVAHLAAYVRRANIHLADQNTENLESGTVSFPDPTVESAA